MARSAQVIIQDPLFCRTQQAVETRMLSKPTSKDFREWADDLWNTTITRFEPILAHELVGNHFEGRIVMTGIIVVSIVVVVGGAGVISYIVALYNSLIRTKHNIEKAFNNIDVLLQQR